MQLHEPADDARMRLALGQRALGHRAGGAQDGERERIVHGERRRRMDELRR